MKRWMRPTSGDPIAGSIELRTGEDAIRCVYLTPSWVISFRSRGVYVRTNVGGTRYGYDAGSWFWSPGSEKC